MSEDARMSWLPREGVGSSLGNSGGQDLCKQASDLNELEDKEGIERKDNRVGIVQI
jgi:hypothetical protein